MFAVRAAFYDLLAALMTLVGALMALAFTAGVVEGALEATDPLEAIVGLVFGGCVVLLAAGLLGGLATWQVLRIGAAWRDAFFAAPDRRRGAVASALVEAGSDFFVGLLMAVLGALRLNQGVRMGETGFAQQGALLVAAAVALGFGAGLARLVRAIRLAVDARGGSQPGSSRQGDPVGGERSTSDENRAREWVHFAFAFCAGLGFVLATVVSIAIGEATP